MPSTKTAEEPIGEGVGAEQVGESVAAIHHALLDCIAALDRRERAAGHIATFLPGDAETQALKRCISEFAIRERATGALPEHVLIRLKQLLPPLDEAADRNTQLHALAVSWCVEAYFE